jgi:hypothetical protein
MPAHIALVGLPHASPKRIMVVKKPFLKPYFFFFLLLIKTLKRIKPPCHGWHGATNNLG